MAASDPEVYLAFFDSDFMLQNDDLYPSSFCD